MESMLQEIAHYVSLTIESIAIAIIALGVIESLIGAARVGFLAEGEPEGLRAVWMRLARWLVAGLTFQLAADLVSTSFNPTWDEIGHLAAIAVIRTFLSFFLEREMDEKRRLSERNRGERDGPLRVDP